MSHPSFQLTLNMLQEAVGLLDAEGQILALNDGCAALLGYDPPEAAEVTGAPFTRLFEEFSAGLTSEILKIVAQEGRWHGEVFFQRADGEIQPVYLIATRLDATASEAAYLFFALNYAEQHYALSDQIRKHVLLQKLLSSAPMGILAATGEGVLMELNGQARALWQAIDAPLALGMTLEAAFAPLAEPLQAAVRDALAGHAGRIPRHPFTAAGGQQVSLEWVPTGRRGNVAETILLFLEDRTAELRLEDQLRETERFASLGFMAANVTHEINNPLQVLRGILERLQRMHRGWPPESVPAELAETTQRGLDAVETIAGIIHPVLDLARPHPPTIEAVTLPALMERIQGSLASHKALRGIAITLAAPPDLPAVQTDAAQVQQIVTNLLVNAAQAMAGSGAITLTLGRFGTDQVTLQVRDTGPGIAPETAGMLFTPFFTTKVPGEGTGLGLYASRVIAQKLGGWLELVPEITPGACFVLSLPIVYDGPTPGAERSWSPGAGFRLPKM